MIGNSWDNVLEEEFKKEYFLKIKEFVEAEYKTKTIYPPKEEIFNAFNLCPIENVKVVILGQDPYHEEGQAHGLAFSTPFQIPDALNPGQSKEFSYSILYSPLKREMQIHTANAVGRPLQTM